MRLHIAAHALAFVADVVVPASVTTVVVVSRDQRVDRSVIVLGIFDARHTVEILAHLALHNLVLLRLQVLRLKVEMQFVVGCICRNHFGLFHVQRNRKNAAQREVRVFDVVPVHLLVNIK